MDKDDLNAMRLMGAIDRSENLSQRDLAKRLNISLGLVNTFIKRLVNKGYFKVKTMPKNRVKYFLTPAGLARKSRLTVEYLKYSVDTYKDIKKLLQSNNITKITSKLKTYGFDYVAVDLEGYRTGSMNEPVLADHRLKV